MWDSKLVGICFIIGLTLVQARVPPRNHETEEATRVERTDDTPVQRSPVESSDDQSTVTQDRPANRKPMVILFRQQPAFSLFANRSPPNPFHPMTFDHDHSHFNHFNIGNPNDDPTVRLISLLFGGHRRPTNRQPESGADGETTSVTTDTSVESSENSRRDAEPFDSLFPHLFPFPRFPIDDSDEKEGEASTSSEDKTPVNFENKEKKVVTIGGRKFVKTVQIKKVKNDFGQFHSVVSSYQPFDEKIHDEHGNEKVKPEETDDSSKDKKDVESSTAASEREQASSSSTVASVDNTPAESSSSIAPEREESTKSPELSSSTRKEAEKLKLPTSESLSNEISDKSSEIKVDQMN